MEDLSGEQRDGFGYLRPNDAVRDAWASTHEVVGALDADVVVQTPSSFDATDEHETNARELLGSMDRGDLALVWEPRRDWDEHLERIAALYRDLDLVHVVDLLRRFPIEVRHPIELNRSVSDLEDVYTDSETIRAMDERRARCERLDTIRLMDRPSCASRR